MENAYLVRADLSGANLAHANLQNAQLRHVNLDGANMVDANLAGANLTGSQLWRAALGSSSDVHLEEYPPHEEVPALVKSIADFPETAKHLEELVKSTTGSGRVQLYFRGEPQCGWDLTPSVMRRGFQRFESSMLLELMSRRPEDFNDVSSSLAHWVLAQHHTLKTRFLDVTKNPLVALFFACHQSSEPYGIWPGEGRLHIFAVPDKLVKPFNSDTVAIITNFAKLPFRDQCALLGEPTDPISADRLYADDYLTALNRLYQLIRGEQPEFTARIDPVDFFRVVVVNPQHFPERIRAQSGSFLTSAFHKRFERAHVVERREIAESCGWNDRIIDYGHYMITIPHQSKRTISDDLQRLNITRETLFPGLDETARAITAMYSMDGDKIPRKTWWPPLVDHNLWRSVD